MMRVRITFAKTEAMQFTSHLDLYHAWERTLRRACLPLLYSQGFKPHPRINIAAALPLGMTSCEDIVDIWLNDFLPLQDIQKKISQASPPGISIQSIEEIDSKSPTLQSQLAAAEFTIFFLNPIDKLYEKTQDIIKGNELMRVRREKSYNLRDLILDIKYLPPDKSDSQCISVIMKAGEGATGRPEELILALGGNPEDCRIQRDRLIFKDKM
jgi:radical SAM-linked protein